MKILILLIIPIFLFSCEINSNEVGNIQTGTDSTRNGEFIINFDTLSINLKPFVSSTFGKYYSLTHAIKYKDNFYCYFTANSDSYKKFFFIISKNGKVEGKIQLPRDITNCFYLDLFVLNDTIYTKPYMNKLNYYLDMQKLIWKEISEPDDVIYEDEKFYVTNLNFGEWGRTTWFKDKLTGKEYELASSSSIINRLENCYYIASGTRILKIENPLKMKKCDTNYYYQIVKKMDYNEGTNSLLGSETIYKDTTYSYWGFQEPETYIATSFKADNQLYYFCYDSIGAYIAQLDSNKLISVKRIEFKYPVFNWSYSYRCRIIENEQLLKFKKNNEFGFIEIKGKQIDVISLAFKE